MFQAFFWVLVGMVLAGVVSIKWPEYWAHLIVVARKAIWGFEVVSVLVKRNQGTGGVLLLACALTFSLGAQPMPPTGMADAWYGWVLRWVLEPVVGPMLVGLVTSWILTQRYKMTLPADLEHERRRRKTQRFSFIAASLPCFFLWPIGWMFESMAWVNIYLVIVSGVVAAALVGCLSPFLYTILMNQAYKRGWVNEAWWSGEARAEAKRAVAESCATPVGTAGQP